MITQLYVQRDIRGYTPAGGDLAYPDKLIVTASIQDKDKSHSDSDSVFASGTEVCSVFVLTVYLHFLTCCCYVHRVMHLVTLRVLQGVERK